MTVEEFIEDYSWEQAREWHADMLAHNSRRRKGHSWTNRANKFAAKLQMLNRLT